MQPLPPLIRWNRSAAVLLSGFFLTIGLIVYVWWPLAEELLRTIDWAGPWWLYMDWLLIGLFLFMSLTIIARADLRRDALIVLVATIGGLVIEAWGTQTNLWFYYTSERPPLWIVPAWPIATLSIDRITRLLGFLTTKGTKGLEAKNRDTAGSGAPASLLASSSSRASAATAPSPSLRASTASEAISSTVRSQHPTWQLAYWMVFLAFLAIMVAFVMPTFDKTATILAFLLCVVLIATPPDHRQSLLVFVAGTALGYFLELWGTTRECWTYYTYQTPPLFAVLAHGMAAVSFWRAGRWVTTLVRQTGSALRRASADVRNVDPTPSPHSAKGEGN